MDRMLLLLAALVLGCDVTDPNDTDTDDTDTTPELFEASFTASLNQYGWDDDQVILLSSEELDKTIHGNGASYIASSEGQTTVSGTTPDLLELANGVWSASYIYADYPIPYVGWATADISESSDLGATLCADLSGDWLCTYDGTDIEIETHDAEMNGCSIQLDGVATGNNELEIDGNKVSDVGPDGSTIRGIATSDSIRFIASNGSMTIYGTCTRI